MARTTSTFELAGNYVVAVGDVPDALSKGVTTTSFDSYDSAVEDAQRREPKEPLAPWKEALCKAAASPPKPHPSLPANAKATSPPPPCPDRANSGAALSSPGPSASEMPPPPVPKAKAKRSKSPTYWRTNK